MAALRLQRMRMMTFQILIIHSPSYLEKRHYKGAICEGAGEGWGERGMKLGVTTNG